VPTVRQTMLPSVPSWMRTPIIPWFRPRLAGHWEDRFIPILLIRFQMEMQEDFGFGPSEVYFEMEVKEFLEGCDDSTFINFLDYVHGTC
jgi:hypothetical protein